MTDVPFVDAHVHLWEIDRFDYSWVHDFPVLDETHGLDAYDEAIDTAPVEGMIFVECTESFDDEVSREEVRWVESLAEEDERIQGIVAHASLEKGEGAQSLLDWLAEQPHVSGVRRIVQDEDVSFLLRPDFVDGIRMLHQYDFSFDLTVQSSQLGTAVTLVDECPGVRFVLDHIGKPRIREDERDPWRTNIGALARRDNVVCKLSGVLTEADPDAWTYEQLVPYLDYVLECFGVDRLLFGGDWPVVRLAADYPTWLSVVYRWTQTWSPAEKRALFRDNAERVYQLPGSE